MAVSPIAQSGMTTATSRLAVAANNVANAQTPDYQAKRVDLEERAEGGVRISQIRAEEGGAVPGQSNVDLATEMTGMVSTAAQMKANAQMLRTEEEMLGLFFDRKA